MSDAEANLLAAEVVHLEHYALRLQDENRILRAMLSESLALAHRLIVSLVAAGA